MTAPSPGLVKLALAHRVSTDFTDWRGHTVEVSAETLTAVLEALGVDAGHPEAALRAREEQDWRRMLPPCVIAIEGAARVVPVHVPDGHPAAVSLVLEDGGLVALAQLDRYVDPREIEGERIGEASFEVPADLPLGYHELIARSGASTARATLIVTPRWLGMPERLGDRRAWGLAAQLYCVRSALSWGVGDLQDLSALAALGGELGAGFVLVNPLHAAEPVPPLEPSPYLPSSRRFFHPLYLRVERVPEFASLTPGERARVDRLGAAVRARAARSDAIERDPAWTAKRAALRILADAPRSPGRAGEFAAYRAREGAALRAVATWSVLAAEHGADFRTWPEGLRAADSPEVAEYAAVHRDEIAFEEWLQWQLDDQLRAAQCSARNASMAIGVVHDLAVGVHPGGADAWRLRDAFAPAISVGAPPDPFNQQGQDWGQPPWRPDALAELAYAPFRDLIAAVLRHAGGVRVDHIIGLFRLWWIPRGLGAREGAYVYYDHEALIGVLALEARRADALVVGEDLGVVDPNARSFLRERGILGTSILWFEREDGEPLAAERWREWCLATVTTHDLPPTAGYLQGDHVRLQHRLGLLAGSLEQDLAADAAERASWLREVGSRGLLPDVGHPTDTEEDPEATVLALHRYLALTPARLVGVSLTDAVGERRAQNQPGTVDEYPNWRVPLGGADGRPMTLEEVIASPRLRRLTRAVDDALTAEWSLDLPGQTAPGRATLGG